MTSNGRSLREFRNEFSWSHSRQETFRACLRRYYYQYYGYWGGWNADADPFARQLYMLKNLKNRYLWAGSIVHDAVAEILEHVRASLPVPEPEAAAEKAVKRMRAEFRQSRDGGYLKEPKRALGLMEHHYREPVSDDVWREFAAMVRRSILYFCSSPHLVAARELRPEDWLTLEKLESYQLDGAKVYVKMDLAYRSPGGGVVICDWKTGRRRPQPEGLQLGCYALYATEAWQIAPEQIQVIEANINTGAVGSARITAEHLAAARDQIIAGIREMRAVLTDPEANAADPNHFPAEPTAQKCGRCAFREACPEFRATLGPRDAARPGIQPTPAAPAS